TVKLFQSGPLDQGNGSDGQGITLFQVLTVLVIQLLSPPSSSI
ncbi:hypothetical protein A2U01_0043194, partial [Trifolium medium]|nr:hypothetical protein [Trifolium medium]